jgi:hypothetical protein
MSKTVIIVEQTVHIMYDRPPKADENAGKAMKKWK